MDGGRVAASTPPLPTGLVTFLLTDVVGSTRLWERAPESMAEALARHEHLITEAVTSNGGILMQSKGEGDSTFSVFAQARDGAAAALAAQRALRQEAWPEPTPITVRMALHTGEVVERDRNYTGRTVNRVARLRAIAEGGEVLVTGATADLIADRVPDGGHLVELGVEQLKDLDRPEIVFALTEHPHEVRRHLSTESALRSLPLPSRFRAARQRPMVGRHAEIARMHEVWTAAAAGHPALIVVRGEAGIGKSRLVGEFAAMVHEHDAIVITGRADELGGSPFEPLAEALRFVAERLPRATLAAMVGSNWPALARLVPDLADSSQPAGDLDEERERLFAGVRSWLRGLTRAAPVLLVVEDLHWSPETTMAVLRSILQRADDERLVIVVTTRWDPATAGPVRRLIEQGRQLGVPVHTIELRGLSADETMQLLGTADRPLVPAAVAAVRGLTDGNPLFILAVASSLTDASTAPDPAALMLPESVHAVLERQIEMLDETSLALLRAAAILGRAFEVDLASELAGASFDDVETALDAGERHLVIRELSAGALHVYEFQHALVASTLLAQLTSIRRRRLHAAAARLVARAPHVDGDRLNRVANHAAAAGTALHATEAIAAFRAAARQARERMAMPEAVVWLEAARRRVDGLDDERLAILVELELGSCALAAGSPDGRTRLRDAAERARQLGDAVLLADVLIAGGSGDMSEYLRVDHDRVQLIELALGAAELDDGRRAKLLVILAHELVFVVDAAPRRVALADEGLTLAHRTDDPAVIDFVADHWLWLLNGPAHVQRRFDEAGELLRRLDQRSTPSHRRFSLLMAQNRVLAELGRVEEGHTNLAQLRAIVDDPGALPRQRLMYTMTSAGWDLLAGRVKEAEASIRTAYGLTRETGQTALGAVTARQMLAVRFWQDRTDTMLDAIAMGVRINPMLLAHQAHWLLRAGRLDDAAVVWAEWDDGPVEALLGAGDTAESVVIEAAAVCATLDGPARCRFYAALLEPYGERIANPLAPDQPTHHVLGLLASALGDHDRARARFEASIACARRAKAPAMAARSSLTLATHLLDLGRESERDWAVALARDAAQVGRELDTVWLVRTAADVLRHAGIG